MRWRGDHISMTQILLLSVVFAGLVHTNEGARRTVQRRKDVSAELFPTPESLQAFAQATGAAGFEAITEGKALVKRLIPANTQPDLDVVEHQGVIGRAGVDFPALPNIPSTGFNCKNVPTGYYADLETDCQVFHICDTSRKISFLCPNGTIFSQSHLICDWWFKVDCASAPTLYESSVEYYSNEQHKSQKNSQILLKNPDLQQIGTDSNGGAESRRSSVNIPNTTERLLRHKQKLQSDILPTAKATARSYQALFNVNPTQRAQVTNAFEKRRKNLVQLFTNNFGNTPKSTVPTYDVSTPKTTPSIDHNSIKEMQVAAETASFANNQNRQFLQQYNSKNYRPYPVYTPNLTASPTKTKGSLTTLYDIQARPVNQNNEELKSGTQFVQAKPTNQYIEETKPVEYVGEANSNTQYVEEATTKRHTLVPYTKSYASILNEKQEPYTRPGVSLLKTYIEREKNKTIYTTTEKISQATARSDKLNSDSKVTIETKNGFESVTKIPLTTRTEQIADTKYSDNLNFYSNSNPTGPDSDPTYQERRERLIRKLNFESFPTELTTPTYTEKYYGDQPNRPGLIVPPSLTPKTLHSLAIYYATALDNLSTTTAPEENEVTTPAIDAYEPIEEGLPGLFSRQTINKYSTLFEPGKNNADIVGDTKVDLNETYNELMEDLAIQMSQGPLASSPQIRELAQVFTHALSAYLQDPVKFRKVLSDIRPTHPSFSEIIVNTEAYNTEPTTTVNEDDDEILGFSDDNKESVYGNSLRAGKALNLVSDYTVTEEPTTTIKPITTTQIPTTTYPSTTYRNPFRCCGKISASYTTASTTATPIDALLSFSTTSPTFNPITASGTENEKYVSTDSYASLVLQRETKDSELSYGKAEGTTVGDYSIATNLPSAWGVDVYESTPTPITNSHQMFESKKIRPTSSFIDTTPVYFTETESIELDNEEELQRAHSQSFVGPQSNSLRQGKQLKLENKVIVKKPSEDLEAPTQSSIDSSTVQITTIPSTTDKDQNDLTTATPAISNIFTSPDSDKPFSENQWSTPLENWQSTIIDPITLNEGLSPTGPEPGVSEIARQTNSWALNTATTLPNEYTSTNEPAVSSTVNVEQTTAANVYNSRFGKLLRDPTSTETQDVTTMNTIVEKAKEIMEGMNATTTQKLMNVMKKTKSSSVKRLILLLVQTCDEDHNKTAEASKKALLDALMAVSQKDMEEMVKEELATETSTTIADTKTAEIQRRSDRTIGESRRGKSVNLEARAINSLSNPTTTTTTTEISKTEEIVTATPSSARTTLSFRRGGKKFQVRTTEQPKSTTLGEPVAEARVAAPHEDVKENSDTRALELLRSLYTIASRWG